MIRAQTYDQVVTDFLQAHPQAIVINLGAGLCTRFFRIDNGTVNWYEVDFPEVMELKSKLVFAGSGVAPLQQDRYHLLPYSILDPSWTKQITREPQQPLLVILEGVSMYLSETDNQALWQLIHQHFAPATVVFDALNTKMAGNTQGHDTVSKTTAKFKWGIDHTQDLENWKAGITIQENIYALGDFVKYPDRLPWWIRPFRQLIKVFLGKSMVIVRMTID